MAQGMSYADFTTRSEKDQQIFAEDLASQSQRDVYDENIHNDITVNPGNVGYLYASKLMPRYATPPTSESDERLSVAIHNSNILNGDLTYSSPQHQVSVSWKGYVSRMHNGKLALHAMSPKATIEGRIKTGDRPPQYFIFANGGLRSGVWPRFLYVYDK